MCDLSLEDHDADLFCSIFVRNCIEREKTVKTGSAIYNFVTIQELKKKTIAAHVSLIYSVNQEFVTVKAGAFIVSPFLGSADDLEQLVFSF